ncbi:putative capsular polysaccharide synthesis family protein [Bythopirellula goksoeyrii]|uniref:putative capsular polysaccharide synthesis family protein n=1 Tax=Bythopirellula goksoeyrii TaxID=1400387 RepID=UPI00143D3F95|nr:putative capsular polysaccharide synthesis family protein [Bythopirellula goksoeyrii]
MDPKKITSENLSGSARWACRNIVLRRKPAKIISLVRHPIDNMLSTFARSDFGQQASQADRDSTQGESIDSDQVLSEFCESYLQSDRYLHPLQWFTTEFQAALGVNVYDYPFDKQNGFVKFSEGPYDVLIMRTEITDEKKSRLVADFLGLPEIEMVNLAITADPSNPLLPGTPGEQTVYAEKYRALKEGIVIPPSYLDTIVNSQYAKHFFTEQERASIRKNYEGTRGSEAVETEDSGQADL